MAPSPFVEEERMDVPFPDPAREEAGLPPIDVVPDVTGGRGDRLRDVIEAEEEFVTPFTGLEGVEITGGGAVFADPVSEIPFAVANVPETQEEFQERASEFVEAFPEITFATSLPGAPVVFGEQLSRESEDFQTALEEEAARSESIFLSLFGNVQNPAFGA